MSLIDVRTSRDIGYRNEVPYASDLSYPIPYIFKNGRNTGMIDFSQPDILDDILTYESAPVSEKFLSNFLADVDRTVTTFHSYVHSLSQDQQAAVNWALNGAYNTHQSEPRQTGMSYMFHILNVMNISARHNLSYLDMISALLHDTPEKLSDEDFARRWGTDFKPKVKTVVQEIRTDPDSIKSLEPTFLVALRNQLFRSYEHLSSVEHGNYRKLINDYTNIREKQLRPAMGNEPEAIKEMYGKINSEINQGLEAVLVTGIRRDLTQQYLDKLQESMDSFLVRNVATGQFKGLEAIDYSMRQITNLSRLKILDSSYAGHIFGIAPYTVRPGINHRDGRDYLSDTETRLHILVADINSGILKFGDRRHNISDMYSYANYLSRADQQQTLDLMQQRQETSQDRHKRMKERIDSIDKRRSPQSKNSMDSNFRLVEMWKGLFAGNHLIEARQHIEASDSGLYQHPLVAQSLEARRVAESELMQEIARQAHLQQRHLIINSKDITRDFVEMQERKIAEFERDGLLYTITETLSDMDQQAKYGALASMFFRTFVPIMRKDEKQEEKFKNDRLTQMIASIVFKRHADKFASDPNFHYRGSESLMRPFFDMAQHMD